MNPTNRIHHLTWVVADLEATLAPLAAWIGADAIVREELPGRGVLAARIRIGDAWLVFVQPTAPGVPATQLASSGEGLLLMSFEVASLERALDALALNGVNPAGAARAGLAEWRVVDLDVRLPGGVTVQICEDGG
jgi:hypothetical protein